MSARPGPRRKLVSLARGFAGLIVLWAGVMVWDLHDGTAWNQRGRLEPGPRFYLIDRSSNPKGFQTVVLLRYMTPFIVLGTLSGVCLLGALAQPKSSQA